MADNLEPIPLGGGCFWYTEAVYERVRGVEKVESGHCNGHIKQPNYAFVVAAKVDKFLSTFARLTRE